MKVKTNKLVVAGLDEIAIGGSNPRIIDEKSVGFRELTESIAGQGVIIPVHVRTDPAAKKPFELLAGERRLRAAKKAGLATVPAIDHGDIGDDEAFEITFTENFQRRDLTVLEHGKAVSILMEKYKNDYAAVASKLGHDERWVRRHECIETNLISEFRKAVSPDGKYTYLTAAHLALVARFPAETQARIYNKITGLYGPVSVDRLEKMVTEMLRILSKAKFDTTGCTKCIKRSSAQPGLWSEQGKSGKPAAGDKCLDPACWEKKEIDSAKGAFKGQAKKYPGLVAISKEYWFGRDEGKRLRKICGKVLMKNDYKICKKSDKGAVPAIMAGTAGGKVYYIKPKKELAASPGKQKTTSLKTKRAELDQKRWSAAIVQMIEKIKAMKFGEMQGDGIFRMNLLIVLYGCDCVLYRGKDRNDFFKSTLKLYKSSADMTPAINHVCEKLWPAVTESLEYDVNTNGDEDSKKEARLLALLFGLDIDAIYNEVCGEPEFAEPAEWTKKKVKSKKEKVKKKSATEVTEGTEKVKSSKLKVESEKAESEGRICRVCGCTDEYLINADGSPRLWADTDLCSACKDKVAL